MNKIAYKLGEEDGAKMAWENTQQGTQVTAGERDFDSALINAIGFDQTAKRFGLSGADRDSEEWQDACSSYEQGARKAWDEFCESVEVID